MKYKGILFDMDVTVLSTLDDLADSVNETLRHFGMPERSMEEVRCFIGNGARRLIELSVAEGTPEALTEEVLGWYKNWYDAHCRIKTAPYEGIVEMLEKLKAAGVKLAVVSNKPDAAVKILAADFFPGLLECAVGDSPAVRRKPWPDTVELAMKEMGLSKEDCCYVGDSEVDVETARRAGTDCVSVSWGFRSIAELEEAGASCIVHNANELYEKLI